jgi:ankyrin repeat protein
MEIHDKNNKILSDLLSQFGLLALPEWSKRVDEYLEQKISTIRAMEKSVPGNLIQSYVAAMKFGSVDVMNKVIAHGFNPTFELLYKHHTVLMEYVSSNQVVDKEVIALHLKHIKDVYADLPSSIATLKLQEYLNRCEPFNKHDAVIMLAKRSAKNNYEGAEKELGEAIKLLGDNGASKSKLDSSNYNALHWSIIEENTKLSIQLIRSMTVDDCCMFNSSGETALSLASKNGAYEVLIGLLKKGVSIEGYYTRQQEPLTLTASMKQKLTANNPLLLAMQNGHRRLALDLVNMGAAFFAANNAHDMHTALIYAVKLKDPELLAALLKKGSNPNEVNSHGFSPLLYLLLDYVTTQEAESKKMIEALLAKGASLDSQSKNGTSGVDLLVKMAQGGVGEAQDWLFKRNVEKLQEFVKSAVGLEFQNVNDLVINDDNLADMRLNRVEQVNSVWLNRSAKSDEYKKSLSEKGFGELKKLTGILSAVGGGSYTGLQFLSAQAETHKFIADQTFLHMLSQNIEVATATITVVTACIGILGITTDKDKRYAVSKWVSENMKKINAVLLDPVISLLRHAHDKQSLRLLTKIDGLKQKFDMINGRVSLAIKAIKGDLEKEDVTPIVVNQEAEVIELEVIKQRRLTSSDNNASQSYLGQ